MDPRTGPVTLTISGTSAALLARIAGDEDPGAIFMRALGLFDLAMKAKRDGKRLVFYDPETEATSDVVF